MNKEHKTTVAGVKVPPVNFLKCTFIQVWYLGFYAVSLKFLLVS